MKVIGSCKISKDGVILNGERQSQYEFTTDDWKKDLYAQLEIDYSKFYKMDSLAKMTFLAFELLEKQGCTNGFEENEVSLIFANRFSSYDTDQKFINSYTDKGNPSPSLFVYTLPNILTGELAIRKKWYGENIFFIQEKFEPGFFIDQINFYLSKGSNACLCGWVDSANNEEHCYLFLVSKDNGEITTEELNKAYNQ